MTFEDPFRATACDSIAAQQLKLNNNKVEMNIADSVIIVSTH